jgi:hypothetical protein
MCISFSRGWIVFIELWRSVLHRLTVYVIADYRGGRVDGYCWAIAAILILGLGAIYL